MHCPYAYITVYRLRQLYEEYRGEIRIEHKSLALEYINKRSTPRVILSEETPILLFRRTSHSLSTLVRSRFRIARTMWSAFEAVKCAQGQGEDYAHDHDWLIRNEVIESN